MATVAHLGTATWDTNAGAKTVTATPAVGDLIVVVSSFTGVDTLSVTDNNPDGKGAYTKIGPTRTGFSTAGNLSVWIRNAFVGSASSTIITTTPNGTSTGGGLDCFNVSGMLRAGGSAARQVAGQSTGTSGTTPAPALGKAVLTGNPVIGAVCNGTSPATMTPRSAPAYTEATDLGYATPTTGLETMFINSGETASTITWGSTSGSAFASVAVELDTGRAGRGKVIVYQGARGEGDPRSQARIGRTYIIRNTKKAPQAGSATREGRYGRSMPAKATLLRPRKAAGPLPASASGSITLNGTAAASGAAAASGSIALNGTATGLGRVYRRIIYRPTERFTTVLRRRGQAIIRRGRRPVIPAAATGSITLSGTATVQAAASASGSISLAGTAIGRARWRPHVIYRTVEQATARFRRLTHAVVARSKPRVIAGTGATGSITLSGTATVSAVAAAAGSLTLAGTATASGAASAAGSITFAGTAGAADPNAATGSADRGGRLGRSVPIKAKIIRNRLPVGFAAFGSIVFTGTGGTPTAPAAASGSITLTGLAQTTTRKPPNRVTVAGQAVQTAIRVRSRGMPLPAALVRGTGTIPAPRKAHPVVSAQHAARNTARLFRRVLRPFLARNRRAPMSGTSATGSITLAGVAAAAASASASGSLTLSGTATAVAPAAATGSLTLSGAVGAVTVPVTAAGSITLSGQGTAFSGVGALGGIVFTGTVGTPTVGATAAGLLILAGTGGTPKAGLAATGQLTFAGTVAAIIARVTAAGSITLTGAVFLVRRDIDVTGTVEGPRFASTLESGRFASTVEGTRFGSQLEE